MEKSSFHGYALNLVAAIGRVDGPKSAAEAVIHIERALLITHDIALEKAAILFEASSEETALEENVRAMKILRPGNVGLTSA
jgi:hypothetical protein